MAPLALDVQKKWEAIYSKQDADLAASTVSLVLEQNQHLLPITGLALDLACGLGANSLFLGEKGLKVHSWDISAVAIYQLDKMALKRNTDIHTQQRDVIANPPEANLYDVIVVSHFLDRDLAAKIISALKPGGILFYQTFCRDKVNDSGPSNPAFLLADNELLRLFNALKVRVYREEALIGQCDLGWRNQAMLVAEKV